MQREGIFREMKLRGHYEKPSEKKAREKAEAVRRARKLARKRLQREGLLPAPKKVVKPLYLCLAGGMDEAGHVPAFRIWRNRPDAPRKPAISPLCAPGRSRP